MPVQRHAAMTWAQRLKRVFKLDVETCRVCGGSARVIACIEDPVVIKKILTYLEEKSPTRAAGDIDLLALEGVPDGLAGVLSGPHPGQTGGQGLPVVVVGW